MKFTSLILILGLLLPFTEGIAGNPDAGAHGAGACCHHPGHAGQDHQHARDHQDTPDAEKESEHDQQMCPFGCDCDCCIHVVADVYHFTSVPEALNRPFRFNLYSNVYQFDFFTPIFEPPRLV